MREASPISFVERKISKRDYRDRFRGVEGSIKLLHASAFYPESDPYPISSYLTALSPDEVWHYGIAHDLFLPSEEGAVRHDVNEQTATEPTFRETGPRSSAELAPS